MNWDFTGMSRPGPGVPPGAPRKKGAARFWEMLTRDFGSLLGANLLCFAAFLPAALAVSLGLYLGNFWVSLLGGLAGGALAGPFYMALADTALRTLQDDPTGWFGRWRSTLAGHWRPAAVTGLALGGLIAVFLFVGGFFLAAMQQEELPALPIWMVLAVDLFLLSLFGVTLPFQLALGRPGFLARLKEGALELLFHPGRVAGAALFQLLWWALLLAMFPISVPFALFLGFWPAALLTGQMLYPVLQSRFELPDYRPAPSPAPAEGYTPAQRSEIWWRLHWGWVLAAVCVASFGLGIVYTLASRSDPDLEVAVVTADYLPDAVVTALQDSLRPYAADRNSDGHVVVQINNYTVTLEGAARDPNLQTAGSTLLVTDLAGRYSEIWIVSEPEAFLEQYGDMVDGSAAVRWQDCPVLTALDAGSYSSDLQADTGDSGQDLLAGCTVLPLRDGDRTVFDALTAR